MVKINNYKVDYKTTITNDDLANAAFDLHNGLKTSYDLEYLQFYQSDNGKYHCRFTKKIEDVIDLINPNELYYLLKILTMGQGSVYFDDVNELCIGMDELKKHYLVLKLAGL